MKEITEYNSVMKIKAEKVDGFTEKITIQGKIFDKDEFKDALIFAINKAISDVYIATDMENIYFEKEYRKFTDTINAL
jgi:hypothetical protein